MFNNKTNNTFNKTKRLTFGPFMLLHFYKNIKGKNFSLIFLNCLQV